VAYSDAVFANAECYDLVKLLLQYREWILTDDNDGSSYRIWGGKVILKFVFKQLQVL